MLPASYGNTLGNRSTKSYAERLDFINHRAEPTQQQQIKLTMNGLLRFAGSDDQDQRQKSEERAEQYESPIMVKQSVPAVILSQDKIRFGPNC